jgi:UDP-N-acetylmuramoyl-L-alanyl-D-glutamate--2,6-diaminopimelate ligase
MSRHAYSIAEALALFDIIVADIDSEALVNDSRLASNLSIFCAVMGSQADGRQYIDSAVASGCPMIIAQCHSMAQHGNILERGVGEKKVPVVQFFELDKHLSKLAQCYYGYPHHALKMVGVTGTNGKTSTSQIIANSFMALDQESAVIGTIGAGKVGDLVEINNTTPGPTELNGLLAKFVQQGVKVVAMEVSSHALDQHRVSPEMMDVAVFTNLSRDHLDYHHTMDEYAKAKFKLFTGTKDQIAVINGDDAYGNTWLTKQTSFDDVIVFGRNDRVATYSRFVKASGIKPTGHGLSFTLQTEKETVEVTSQLVGDFNVDNLIAAISVLRAVEISLTDIIKILPNIKPCDGRMETFYKEGFATCIVDYAHTPDALENALKACQQHCENKLWVVFGCGGDRDQGKRALMGEIAERLADHVVVTNDNPRHEAPEMIVSSILSGCNHPEKITVMLDRKQAVSSTLSSAGPNDIVLLAGKGHEHTIQIGDEIIEYNERQLVMSIFNKNIEHGGASE